MGHEVESLEKAAVKNGILLQKKSSLLRADRFLRHFE